MKSLIGQCVLPPLLKAKAQGATNHLSQSDCQTSLLRLQTEAERDLEEGEKGTFSAVCVFQTFAEIKSMTEILHLALFSVATGMGLTIFHLIEQ